MSLKSEFAELIDWLAEITTDKPSAPDPQPLARDDWELVRDNLESAAKSFNEAGDLGPKPNKGSPRSVAADLAYDLSLEAQSLADRAYVLGRRARPKVDKSADELAKDLASKTTANQRLTSRVKNLEAEVQRLEAGAPRADPKPASKPAAKEQKAAADHVDLGQRAVATARDNLFNVTPAEQAVLDFAEKLEVLNDLIAGWRRVSRRSA